MTLPKLVVSPLRTPSQLHLAMQIMKRENQAIHPGFSIVTGTMEVPVCLLVRRVCGNTNQPLHSLTASQIVSKGPLELSSAPTSLTF